MARPRRVLWVCVAIVLVGACSSGSPPAAGPETTGAASASTTASPATPVAGGDDGPTEVETFAVPNGSHPHDVAPAADGSVWYTAQNGAALGRLDPPTGRTHNVPLGAGSAPHGVIIGPDGAPWVTDGGLNAVVRVDPRSEEVRVYPMPAGTPSINFNTAVFGRDGTLWFTGQNGYYGRLDGAAGGGAGAKVQVFNAPRGRGPYGITATPDGSVYYASLAGNHIARIDPATNSATPIDPPTAGQGARRVWADSKGRVWVSEWNAGQVGVYDPANGSWREWKLPGGGPQAYAVYVDDKDKVWLSDFGGNAIVRFDPATEQFRTFPLAEANAAVRQLLGRPGELWGAESGADRLVVIRPTP